MVDQIKKDFFVVLTASSWQHRDILTYIFLSFCFSNTLCNVFVAKKHGKDAYVCVTNTSFALSWVDTDMRDTLAKVSSYIPNPIHDSFDCDLTDDEQTRRCFLKKPWSLKNSLDSDISDIILDRRWENFETIQTGPKGLNYEMVKFPLDSDFAVPLSVRGEEAHIFLCDGDGLSPAQHNCYWVMLQSSNGTASALHKCRKVMVPTFVKEEPSCDTLSRIEHSSFKNGKTEAPTYISNKLWSHFKVTRNGNQLILMNRTGGTILQWNDAVQGDRINVTRMFLHSKMVDVFWKIHQFDYFYTTDKITKIAFGPPLQAVEESICISMFVAMCQYCQLILTLTHHNGTFTNSTTYMNPDWGWSEIQFRAENITEGNYVLSVSTIGSSLKRFWAIDSVRQCQKKEYRMISSHKKAACQLMSADDNLISFDDANLTISDERQCLESTIGPFCVPCRWIYQDCDRINICSQNKCYCSAGYQDGECFDACPRAMKRYGHGCLKNCSSTCFERYCHYQDGTCESCSIHYAGSTCETFIAIHLLVAPRVININYTGASVSMDDFQVYEVVNDDEPWTYTFQYKEADSRDSKWMNGSGSIKFPKNETVEIGGLTIATTYLVRCVVTTIQNVTYVGDRVPVTRFTTKCQDFPTNNIEVKMSNTTANISLIRTNRSTCTFKNYSLSIYPKVPSKQVSDDNIFFDQLMPYTKYTVTLENDSEITKEFQTQEGVPEPVSKIQVLKQSTSSVKLRWHTPHNFYGIFKHYIVEYQQKSYMACTNKVSNLPLQHKISQEPKVTVDGLTPFAEYVFWVSSVNTANLQGPKRTITAYTLSSGVIEDEEIPQSIITPDVNKVTVNFTKTDCTKVRGSALSVKMILRCTSEWCTTWTRDWQLLNHSIIVGDLIPFSDYRLSLQFCRNHSICTNATRNKFRTKSTVPHMVSDLLVYSKNDSSISLRWKPPYPPTGVLASYKIDYDCKTCQKKDEIFNTSFCNLWSDFHCVKITTLTKNEEYNLTVYARNKDPDGFGQPGQIAATTRTEPPEAPYDLRLSWNAKNDLELQWKHPNRSNGDIRYFRIDITPVSQGSTNDTVVPAILVHPVDCRYNLTYYYKVLSEVLIPSTRYDISVFADNGHFGEKVTETDTSPPEVPYFDQSPYFNSTNETVVHFRLKKPRWIDRSNYTVFLLISDHCNGNGSENTNITSYPQLEDFNLKNLRVVSTRKVINFENEVALSIGKNTKNLLLTPGISCNITVMVMNTFLNKSRSSVFSDVLGNKTNSLDFVKLLPWLALPVVVLIAIILFVKRHQLARFFKNHKKSNDGVLQLGDINVDREGVDAATISQAVTGETELNVLSKLIKLADFKTYVEESLTNGEFENQHEMISKKSTDYVYETVKGHQYFDYVDMEYTDGLTIEKAYIATEVPEIDAIADFWKTLWEENVEHIVLLDDCTNGKFTKYWPTKQNPMKCHKISIQVAYSQGSPNCVHRTFIMIYRKQIKHIDQIHFSYSCLNPRKFVKLLKTLSSYPLKRASPICIHSSVGMEQTGLVLLCDMCIRMGKKEDAVDVLKSAKRLITHNRAMINKIEHYKVVHSVIVEYFFGEESDTSDSSSECLHI